MVSQKKSAGAGIPPPSGRVIIYNMVLAKELEQRTMVLLRNKELVGPGRVFLGDHLENALAP